MITSKMKQVFLGFLVDPKRDMSAKHQTQQKEAAQNQTEDMHSCIDSRCAPVLIMDTKDPEAGMLHGHSAVGLETRGQRKLLALLFAHGILTCACAALCTYTLYKVQRTEEALHKTPLPEDKGIYLNMQKDLKFSTYLNFTVVWNNSLTLEHGSEVMVPLAGPYVFYICALVKGHGTKGNLTLSQGHTNISFELSAQSGTRCVRQQRVISLYEKEKITFSFRNTYDPYLFLQVLKVGLHYLLGAQDFDTPEYDPHA
ncbi:uncharacterized protein LOC128601116 isoform X2 [Ictalurus furcatus]|uniref:uncharacterized protein LOC128601116 isoform X2 n=1 Tax=Ictalurus furcatus TaxID=66913 RepID=UPI002350CB07|nr:uncharacterized protein LOC128601116 isoform X2 [Ictalurus furcatus]